MLVLILLIVCLVYLILNRNLIDIFLYSYIAAIPMSMQVARYEARRYFDDDKETNRDKLLLSVKLLLPTLAFAIIFIPLDIGIYGVAAALFDGIQWGAAALTERGRSTTLAAVATALTGLVLFAFRLKFRFVYGLTETMVGLLVAGHRVNT